MKDKTIDMGSYLLHLIPTKRFKTITIRVCLRDTIVKEEITLRNFLASFLTYATDTYRTKRELVLHCQDLYALNISTKTYRAGKFNMMNFFMSTLNEKYTEEGMLEKSIELFADVIFHPNFNDLDKFKEAYDFLKQSTENALKGLKENPSLYSVTRMLETMGPNMPYSYREQGYLEDLNNVNLDTLKQYYQKMMIGSLVDIYVIGDFEEEAIVSLLKKYMEFDTFKRPKDSQMIYHSKLPQRTKTVIEKINGNQSKLSIGCKIGELTEFERNYVLTLYNMILGGSSESKFFQIIREKHSLAYYVYSSVTKLDHIMIIRAGITKENFNKTIKLIKKLMKEMEQGKFTEENIEFAKQNYLSLLKEIEDNENAIIETYLAKDLLNLGNIEERKEEIKKVTKEDIINVSKKVKMDTIYLLEGDKENEGD
ncbi:MAG: pitrilysin family protein [bacterium]|nr:pitrilysin family protein [bacterium]